MLQHKPPFVDHCAYDLDAILSFVYGALSPGQAANQLDLPRSKHSRARASRGGGLPELRRRLAEFALESASELSALIEPGIECSADDPGFRLGEGQPPCAFSRHASAAVNLDVAATG